jgi:ribosome recycling factor
MLKKIKNLPEISSDNFKKAEKRIQDITDSYCKIIDETANKKEKEIMKI